LRGHLLSLRPRVQFSKQRASNKIGYFPKLSFAIAVDLVVPHVRFAAIALVAGKSCRR
jgi:type III secretory pathway component EscR